MGEEASGARRSMRSEERIPRLRSRGRANRRQLLAAAERLLAAAGTHKLRFSDVFTAAGVSRGSAYRIYMGLDDLLHDLVSEWLNNFVDHLASSEPPAEPEDWMTLSDFLVERAAAYWKDTEETLRVLPRIRINVPESHQRSQRALSRIIGEIFSRYFVLPGSEDWDAVIGFYVQICDATFSDSVRREGRITAQRKSEAQALCRTYLAFYLPSWLPSRVDASRSRT